MEIILLERVAKLGAMGDVVNVKDGYARNFLLPKKLAVQANASNKKIVEQERDAYLRREAKAKNEAEDLGRMLSGVTITITQRAGEEGRDRRHDQRTDQQYELATIHDSSCLSGAV